MSNQYYDFLTTRLVGWLDDQNINFGDRFYLLLNSMDEVNAFVETLKNTTNNNPLKFDMRDDGLNFEGLSLEIQDKKVIFVNTSDGVSQDFFVTLRNRVSDQQGIWQNTVLFFICHEALDSIVGGAFDVSKQDGPFNPDAIKRSLKEEVEKTDLSKAQKNILEIFSTKLIEDESMYFTLNDFENVFSIIEAKKITEDDFISLGYFPDFQIETLAVDRKQAEKRLEENRAAFQKIERFHSYTDTQEQLLGLIEGKDVVNRLTKEEEWKHVGFREVKNGIDKLKKSQNVKLSYLDDKIQEINPDIEIWDKSDEGGSKSSAKAKKRNLFLFPSEAIGNTFELLIPFDDIVSNKDISNTTILFQNNKAIPHKIECKGKRICMFIEDYDRGSIYSGQIVYRHKQKGNLIFTIRFIIFSGKSELLTSIKPLYRLSVSKSKGYSIELRPENQIVSLGDAEETQTIPIVDESQLDDIVLPKDESLLLNFENYSTEETSIPFNVRIEGTSMLIPFRIWDSQIKPSPKSAIEIERLRYNSNEQMEYIDGKIFQGTAIHYLHSYYQDILNLEQQIISNRILSGLIINDEVISSKQDYPENILNHFERLCEYLEKNKTVMSTATWTDELNEIVELFCEEVTQVINSLDEEQKVPRNYLNVTSIGRFLTDSEIVLSPFSPLLLGYARYMNRQLTSESISTNMLKQFNAKNLYPYIESKGILYESFYDSQVPRWLIYTTEKDKKLSELTVEVISSRLKNYVNYFSYIFSINDKMALNIAIIHMNDYEELLKAFISYFVSEMKNNQKANKSPYEVNPINIYIDTKRNFKTNVFEEFYSIKFLNDFEKIVGTSYSKYKVKDIEFEDLLQFLKEQINIFEDVNDDQYYHICFYQFNQISRPSSYSMKELAVSYSLGGLINSPNYDLIVDKYVNGYGYENIVTSEYGNELTRFVSKWNALSLATKTDLELFRPDQTLVNNIDSIDSTELDKYFSNSSWVTFLNPDVDLGYFTNSTHNLFVIHYTDQTSSANFDSITVTKDIEQYEKILFDHINKFDQEVKKENMPDIIKSFNILNGEWLLNLIGRKATANSNSNIFREKLSMISAYKETLGILDSPNIFWVPISLEEILRVSGMIGLKQKDGLFSNKSLGYSGSTSDDLLFMGLEIIGSKIEVHLVPIEVKVGNNPSAVIDKAIQQVLHTRKILEEVLITPKEGVEPLVTDFYRNFYLNLYFTNLDKLINNEIWIEKDYSKINSLKASILNGNYVFSKKINEHYCNGIVFSFKNEQAYRTIQKEEKGLLMVNVPEMDAYNLVYRSVPDIVGQIVEGHFDFDPMGLLRNAEIPITEGMELIEKTTTDSEVFSKAQTLSESDLVKNINPNETFDLILEVAKEEHKKYSPKEEIESQILESEIERPFEPHLSEKRLLIGHVKGSSKSVYWEYGHQELANRHMLITGKSGQGKTYFIQTLLYELSKNKISSIVFDYTDGFIKSQLEEEFLSKVGDKLDIKLVYQTNLPINPFKKQKIDLGDGDFFDESDQDMVDRVLQVLDYVFDLGIQQRHFLSQVLSLGIRVNGDDYTFSMLKNDLINDEDSRAANLLGRISELLDRDPFTYKNGSVDWEDYLDDSGKIHIFQLRSIQPNIQKVMIEFMLWDLFNYSTMKGNKNKPIPVVLDEIQNLSFKENAPTVKILKEGRKFGWSGIFATQSLNSIKGAVDSLFNAQQQVHFSPPEDQIGNVAKTLSSNQNERRVLEAKLAHLAKGECVINGQLLNEPLSKLTRLVDVVKIESLGNRR